MIRRISITLLFICSFTFVGSCKGAQLVRKPLASDYMVVANMTLNEWVKAGKLFNRTCWSSMKDSRVLVAGWDLFDKYCRIEEPISGSISRIKTPVSAGGTLYGCHTIYDGSSLILIDKSLNYNERLKTLAHEYLHLLGKCSLDPLGTDGKHLDVVRWKIILPILEREIDRIY